MRGQYTIMISVAILICLFSYVWSNNQEIYSWMTIAICISPICIMLDWIDNKRGKLEEEQKTL